MRRAGVGGPLEVHPGERYAALQVRRALRVRARPPPRRPQRPHVRRGREVERAAAEVRQRVLRRAATHQTGRILALDQQHEVRNEQSVKS